MISRCAWLRTAAVVLAASAAVHGQDEPVSFEGRWQTNMGLLILRQEGERAVGDCGQITIDGTVRGRKLEFQVLRGPASVGTGSVELARDGGCDRCHDRRSA